MLQLTQEYEFIAGLIKVYLGHAPQHLTSNINWTRSYDIVVTIFPVYMKNKYDELDGTLLKKFKPIRHFPPDRGEPN